MSDDGMTIIIVYTKAESRYRYDIIQNIHTHYIDYLARFSHHFRVQILIYI